MAIRHTASNRSLNGASLPNRKSASTAANTSIHSSGVDDEKAIPLNSFKQEKLAAGIRAADKYNYREAIKQFALIKPDTTTSLYLAGCSRLELQHYAQSQEAVVDFTKCLELLSEDEQSPFALELWYKRALAYHNIGKYDEAIADYTEYINRCKSLREPYHKGLIARGLTYQVMYDLDIALKDINEANTLTYNKNPYYLCCRASVYTSKNEIDKAVADLERASNVGCYHDVEGLFQRGIVLAELNRHNAALEDLQKALTLSSKPSQQADICFRCGLSEYVLNNKEQAFQWLSRATSLHPYHAQAYYHFGIIQTEKEQYKDALKTLNRAHDLSPQQSDILFQRAIINEHLGKLNDAANDRKHGIKLNMTDFAIITMLANRIKILRKEIKHTDSSSPRSYLELAIAYDGLLTRKKNLTTKLEFYREAIFAYGTTIETDTKYLYPQARALLALCYQKMNDLVVAHEVHFEFYNVLSKYKGAVYHWKTYLLDVKDKMESGKIEPHLDQNAISQLIHMETNRRKQNIDEETLQNDIEDHYKNQLIFYEQLRIDLSNILAAIAVLNLDRDNIINNVEDTSYKVSKIIQLLSEDKTSISDIESMLNSDDNVSTKVLRKTDYNIIKMKLKSIGNVGNMTDQLDVAQLVARHLCTRYRSQLLCLKHNNDNIVNNEPTVNQPSGSSWLCCSSGSRVFSPKEPISSSYENDTFKKIVTFAIAFTIKTLNSETVKASSNEKSSRRDALATTLVLIICRAHLDTDTSLFSSFRLKNVFLPIDSTVLSKILKDSQQTIPDENTLPIEWNLYDLFRAPGIYYHSDGDIGKIRYYGSDPLMMPDIYGYRLGTREEVHVFKKLHQENK
ncbi:unnamed protein product [Rotaria sordida]|uniref:Uncharacterized protein n=1 Tax=Rotaria sordida TaxID=392033 RepID=A0A815BR60_9BILA|nr:unnamed protein product [Rotaria sordida]CAF1277007.1 unnamed protein product [Rotaria sordida]